MGVTGLWTVVQPCARPIKIETLNRKRLAVDASIWIYQFLKAVRDKEGNALRNSHVVGFFRRICKLLFIGIKPVFVFDGGAPILKKQTVTARKSRREGRREDAVRTAGKLLAIQMQRRAQEDESRRKQNQNRASAGRRLAQDEEEELQTMDGMVFAEEALMTTQERMQSRTFKKKDAYHLPNLDFNLTEMGSSSDPRIMSHEELEEYARHFHEGEDINLYDFSKIDFESTFFQSLPAADRYNILNAARLRSRLRMGYSKEQLEVMFPNRMDFSRFQIDRVKERNELTQRLMNINGMNDENALMSINGGGRIAGERGKEYVLVKNDGVEGGWALGVVSNKEGAKVQPIDVDKIDKNGDYNDFANDSNSAGEDEEHDFEDIPIEGLNRLPKRSILHKTSDVKVLEGTHISEANYHSADVVSNEHMIQHETKSGDLFLSSDSEPDVPESGLIEASHSLADDDVDLARAIAISLLPNEEKQIETEDESGSEDLSTFSTAPIAGPRIDQPLEFNNKNAKSGRSVAHLANARSRQVAKFHQRSACNNHHNGDPAVATRAYSSQKVESKGHAHDPNSLKQKFDAVPGSMTMSGSITNNNGPLPFESIQLGRSILGRKKKPKPELEGGFERADKGQVSVEPLPPWFAGDVRSSAPTAIEFGNGAPTAIDKFSPDKHAGESRANVEQSPTAALDEDTDEICPVKPKSIASLSDEEVDEGVAWEEVTSQRHDHSKAHDRRRQTEQRTVLHSLGESTQILATGVIEQRSESSDLTKLDTIATLSPQVVDFKQSQTTNISSPYVEPEIDTYRPATLTSEGMILPQDDEHISSVLNDDEGEDFSIFTNTNNDSDDDVYSDPEDAELLHQLATEAEEHVRFVSSLNANPQIHNAEEYERELRQLRNQQKRERRDADEVSNVMITECQQLLRLFGLPYITAPMEAEAQCAQLMELGLVDGIVTDDSDVFLFGGTRVYKNMFNQAKFVECYLANDFEKEYGLTREKLIKLAHLLGSDYTEGLPSVGPVTAMEIITEFGTLEKFAEWWGAISMAAKPVAEDVATPFKRKFRKAASKILLPSIFPDTRVDDAYLHPEVDNDTEAFQWGTPDLDALRQFLMTTIGWSQERTDEILVPVIKDINRRDKEGTQANIPHFFSGQVGSGVRTSAIGDNSVAKLNSRVSEDIAAPRRMRTGKSRRMESALDRLHAQTRAREATESTGVFFDTNKELEDPKSNSGGKAVRKKRKLLVDGG